MELFKLKGITKSYIWGGKRLFSYGKNSSEDSIAESWELSYQPGNESKNDNLNIEINKLLNEKDLGSNCKKFPFFPLLIKLIDANDDLSIQVHPNDDYALINENSFGKTEMWYVLDCLPNSYLHIGLNKDISKEEFIERISNNTILEVMNHIKVNPGDCYFIPSETLHAIGKGCLIYEVQENSNLTYRVYDYDRVDKNGNHRELHINKAKEVTNLNKIDIKNLKDNNPLMDCNYFIVEKLINPKKIQANSTSFKCITIIEGNGKINDLEFSKGDSFFLPANKNATIKGSCVCIVSSV